MNSVQLKGFEKEVTLHILLLLVFFMVVTNRIEDVRRGCHIVDNTNKELDTITLLVPVLLYF